MAKARTIAFYLPQFHEVEENNIWWGPGFTEWTNAARARRLFPGHRQPHLPGELGFYDLSVPGVRSRQVALAAEHGVDALCYWHYWFGGGRTILENPLRAVLDSDDDHGLMLGWANHSWTNRWGGANDQLNIEQHYPGPDDEARHADYLMPFFTDPRYVRVDGKPVFYLFRPVDIPDQERWVASFRELMAARGLPGVYLVAEIQNMYGADPNLQPGTLYDAYAESRFPFTRGRANVLRKKALRRVGGPMIFPYATADELEPSILPPDKLCPMIYPNWDNTPRVGRDGVVLTGSSPERFATHLRAALQQAEARPEQERLVFLKSWNEWAEGNYLEPDLEHGRGWLEAIRGTRASMGL